MLIKVDDISTPAIRALISLHVSELNRMVPSSQDVLDISSLQAPNITVFSAWTEEEEEEDSKEAQLLGCGALKELSPTHGEIKSMRTVAAHVRKGVGRAIVEHLVAVARDQRGYTRLSLETGDDEAFASARRFYGNLGFEVCEPYVAGPPCPQSVFMSRNIVEG